ncbi:transient receptor potential cation channel subfamily A member 1-like isoform X2 [Stylophora pistillata]|nr:transient receptor potential cation channel subfamily A member 1-like isoform X1 [Stylophora pistillata]XP_022804426.1 transient receptor potential cation channel subfamily A member 1-like isoform X2 [Stylophora pistillata]
MTDFRLQDCLHFSACHGHLEVTKYLLDQGAAVDSRCDERLTPLIQSAFCGCNLTTGLLLDRGAKIDATDKNGCTALIAAASRGKVSILQLLLDRGADIRLLTTDGKNCLQTAIANGHQDVCMEIIKHVRWKEAFPVCDERSNFIPLKSLIETFPSVAKVVMDKCIQNSYHLQTDEDYSLTYDFEYVNPDPSLLSDGRVFFAPKTMLDYGREELIFHPLIIELMRCKWQHMGVRFFYISAVIYLFYLGNLTFYMLCIQHLYLLNPVRPVIPDGQNVCITARIEVWEIFIAVMTAVYLLIEMHQAFWEKWNYIETSNIAEICTFSTALISILSEHLGLEFSDKCVFLAISVLFGYLTLLLYLQSIFESGIHVTMLFVVLKTLGKVAIMFSILIFAFALVFQMLLSKKVNAIALNMTMNGTLLDDIEKDPFQSLHLSLVKVVAMTIGELEYTRFFTDQQLFSPTFSQAVFLVFCVMMPIVLMNLTIGLAIGDIDSIRQNAEYKRLSIKIEVIHEFIEKSPLWLLHRLHQPKSVKQPNKKAKTILQKIKGLGDRLVSGQKPKYTVEDAERNLADHLTKILTSRMREQDDRISGITLEMREQRKLLESLFQRMVKKEARRTLSDD